MKRYVLVNTNDGSHYPLRICFGFGVTEEKCIDDAVAQVSGCVPGNYGHCNWLAADATLEGLLDNMSESALDSCLDVPVDYKQGQTT